MSHGSKSSISLKLLIKRLRNHLRLPIASRGHFSVVAKNEDEKPTRFVVELRVLKHPEFLRLLKMAEEEYGFRQRGALAVPCGPEELRRILQDRRREAAC